MFSYNYCLLRIKGIWKVFQGDKLWILKAFLSFISSGKPNRKSYTNEKICFETFAKNSRKLRTHTIKQHANMTSDVRKKDIFIVDPQIWNCSFVCLFKNWILFVMHAIRKLNNFIVLFETQILMFVCIVMSYHDVELKMHQNYFMCRKMYKVQNNLL